MSAQPNDRGEGMRRAMEAARVVLAKHPCVVPSRASQATPARVAAPLDGMGARNVVAALSR